VRTAGLLAAGGCLLFCCERVAVPIGSPSEGRAALLLATPVADTPPLLELDAAGSDARDPVDDSPDDGPLSDASDAAAIELLPPDDPMALHHEDPESLRALMGKAASLALPVGGGAWRIGQGNRSISHHAIGGRACLERLRDVVLQTPEQLARCGEANMVPVWNKGSTRDTARFCIDVFEFPDKACELPFVFVTPPQAKRICEAQGKRLCTQDEWSLSCRGDPAGGPDRLYAYGDELDLTICNTDKSRLGTSPVCDVSTEEKVGTTCGTNTEPAGSYPGCRSRFGVFDQHGNVAEIMTRFEPADGEVKSQLKGSAFFYVDVAKKPSDPGGYWTKYPDQCDFDPRWHVEKLEAAVHLNYHLGFRCCKSLTTHAEHGLPDASP
jgi:formylglycine-generating enzyme